MDLDPGEPLREPIRYYRWCLAAAVISFLIWLIFSNALSGMISALVHWGAPGTPH
jgi:hypothetical protein